MARAMRTSACADGGTRHAGLVELPDVDALLAQPVGQFAGIENRGLDRDFGAAAERNSR